MNYNMLYYVHINLFCVILMVNMFIVMNSKRSGKQTKTRMFNWIVGTSVVMCLSDIFTWLSNGADFTGARVVNYASNMLYYIALTLCCFEWLLYVNVRIHDYGYHFRERLWLMAVPMFIMVTLILTTPVTEFIFYVDEANVYHRGDGVFLHWIISYAYLLISLIQTILAMKTAETNARRRELRPLLTFALWPVIAAVIQMLFFGASTTQCGITLGIITITLQNMRSEITTDELTGVNNRAAFENYITEHLRFGGESFCIFMADVDKFKTINDTMGHPVGDLALKTVAKVLRISCEKTMPNAFLCRYGGDEFVLCLPRESDDFSRFYRCCEDQFAKKENMPAQLVSLSLSFGVATRFCSTHADVEQLLKEADEEMYKNKKGRNVAR